jgi:hypothetical protein
MTQPTHEEIAKKAYALYLARGARDGHDVRDWLEAERSIKAQPLGSAREESVATEQYENADLEERTPG